MANPATAPTMYWTSRTATTAIARISSHLVSLSSVEGAVAGALGAAPAVPG